MSIGEFELEAMLGYILQDWMILPPTLQPEMVWVTLHKEVEIDSDFVTTIAERSWFLTTGKLEQRPLDEYEVFINVKVDPIWNRAEFPPNDLSFGRGKHEIAMVRFAPYPELRNFQVELLWGSLHGRERIVKVNEDGSVEEVRGIWIS